MYVDSSWEGDSSFATKLRTNIEPLLLQAQVDMAIWGHDHCYQRFCPAADLKCDSTNGIQHLVIGMAGYELSRTKPKNPSPLVQKVPSFLVYSLTRAL
jgi:hypothetical protein